MEPVILGVRGGMWHSIKGGITGQVIHTHFPDSQAFLESHPRDEAGKIIHSRKPEEFWRRLNQWLPRADKLEIFATEHRPEPNIKCLGHALSGNDLAVDLMIHAAAIQAAQPKPIILYNPKIKTNP